MSDTLVDRIIREPKYISSRVDLHDLSLSDKKGHLMKNVKLECDAYECRMMIRQTVDRPSNFSVVLVYKDSNRNDRVILRLNGNHGRHRNRIEGTIVDGPHIHKMTERYQRRTNHPDGYAEATERYSDLDGAIEAFMEIANVKYDENRKTRRLEDFA